MAKTRKARTKKCTKCNDSFHGNSDAVICIRCDIKNKKAVARAAGECDLCGKRNRPLSEVLNRYMHPEDPKAVMLICEKCRIKHILSIIG
jgi:hypothetical protein